MDITARNHCEEECGLGTLEYTCPGCRNNITDHDGWWVYSQQQSPWKINCPNCHCELVFDRDMMFLNSSIINQLVGERDLLLGKVDHLVAANVKLTILKNKLIATANELGGDVSKIAIKLQELIEKERELDTKSAEIENRVKSLIENIGKLVARHQNDKRLIIAEKKAMEAEKNRLLREVSILSLSIEQQKVENAGLKDEIVRLREGNFTPEEFQNLCHNLGPVCTPGKFRVGCDQYFQQLFGRKPTPADSED